MVLSQTTIMTHMTVCGQSGIELYQEDAWGHHAVRAERPPITRDGRSYQPWLTTEFTLSGAGMCTLCIYLPLYNGEERLLIGVPEGASVSAPRHRNVETPVVFYGSSITQGACAAKPGACYLAILGRRLDANILNLGFSGATLAEEAIVHYIAGLKMSAFVMDYDHNAGTQEFLRDTHEKMYRIIRKAQPMLPMVMVSAPNFDGNPALMDARREVVRQTWRKAKAEGDELVWFVDGETLFGHTDRDLCTVDGLHPTTLGFLRMADGIEPTLKSALVAAGK